MAQEILGQDHHLAHRIDHEGRAMPGRDSHAERVVAVHQILQRHPQRHLVQRTMEAQLKHLIEREIRLRPQHRGEMDLDHRLGHRERPAHSFHGIGTLRPRRFRKKAAILELGDTAPERIDHQIDIRVRVLGR